MQYRTPLGAVLVIAMCAGPALAKRVICVAPQNNGYDHHLEAGKGYYGSNPQPGDIIDDSGDLQACLDQLVDGDKFILIAHGTPGRFDWDGTTYRGFGSAPDQFDAQGIDDVRVTICIQACHSNEQPSLPVEDPLRENLENAFEEKSTATGWTGEVEFPCKISGDYDPEFDPEHDPKNPLGQADIDARVAAANACLADDDSWASEPWDEQQQAAQDIIDACDGAVGIRMTFTWCPPQVRDAGTGGRRFGDIELVYGCGPCAVPGCGYATYILLGPVAPIPTLSQWGMIWLGLAFATAGTLVIRRSRSLTAAV